MYRGLPYSDLWSQQSYMALWVVQRISLLLLQCTAAHATAMSFKDTEGGWLPSAAMTLMASVRQL